MCQVFNNRADRLVSYFPFAINHGVWLARKLEVWKWDTMKCRTMQGLKSLHFILSNKAKENTWRRESVCANGSLRGKMKPCTIKLRHSYVQHRNILFLKKKSQKSPVCFINNKEVTARGMKVKEVVFETEGIMRTDQLWNTRGNGTGFHRFPAWERPQGSEERFVQIEMATTALGSGSASGNVSLAWG